MLEVPGYPAAVRNLMKKTGCYAFAAEYGLWGTSHAEVGAYLLGLWGIPDSVVEAVAFHHQPSKLVGDKFLALTAVHVANGLWHQGDSSRSVTGSPVIDFHYLSRLGLTDRIEKWAHYCDNIRKGELQS